MTSGYADCIGCGNKNFGFMYNFFDGTRCFKDKLRLVKCKSCGLMFINPLPSREKLGSYVQNQLFSEIDDGSYSSQVKKILSVKDKGKILDIGCGRGFFLNRMKQSGWSAFGVELNKEMAAHAKEKFGLDIFCGTLQETKFPDGSFDAVNLRHVLEHLLSPYQTLIHIHRVLKQDGTIVITVPNFEGFQRKIFGRYYLAVAGIFHISQFTPRSLKSLLERAGYRAISIKTFQESASAWLYGESLRYLLRDLRLYPQKQALAGRSNSLDGASPRSSNRISVKDSLHSIEQILFEAVGGIGAGLGMGDVMICCARKV
ncbi:MAG: class I SAM-dependent methyltransferase [Candidatus Omnitrophota bacterium]|jgi:SAM-dependent methyltransferase